jgi:hypothetical protein
MQCALGKVRMCSTRVTLEYLATLFAIASAAVWFLAAKIEFPTLGGILGDIDPDIARRSNEAFRAQANRNKWAAVLTAAAVFLFALAMAVPCGQTAGGGTDLFWMLNWDDATRKKAGELTGLVTPFLTPIILIITLIFTIRMTISQKRSDNAKDFGGQFNKLMDDKDAILRQEVNDGTTASDRTSIQRNLYHYYNQLYALQFTEFYAYRARYLERRIFTLWMRSRAREYAQENIHGLLACQQGWTNWLNERHGNAVDDYTKFMDKVHRCGIDHRAVDRVVGRHGAWWQRWRWWIPFL